MRETDNEIIARIENRRNEPPEPDLCPECTAEIDEDGKCSDVCGWSGEPKEPGGFEDEDYREHWPMK